MENRKDRFKLQYSLKKLLYRIFWKVLGYNLFLIIPNRLFFIRNYILRFFGSSIGKGSRIYNSVVIEFPNNFICGEGVVIGKYVRIKNHSVLKIGDYTTISQFTSITDSSHDYSLPSFPLFSKAITIGDNVWLAEDVFVGPGVIISPNTIVGSRGVVMKSIENGIYFGNPLIKKK